jgi:hypothetical protein
VGMIFGVIAELFDDLCKQVRTCVARSSCSAGSESGSKSLAN